jgi:maltose O-acetyltransferase
MIAGEGYKPDDPELVTDRRHCQELLRNFNARPEQELKYSGLDRLFAAVGEDIYLMSPFLCDYGFNISIGAGSFINYGAVVLDSAPVTIGDGVQIGTGVHLVTAEHPLDPAERRTGVETARPITIEDGVWIGSGAIVCPGVTIGENSVIGAGSVVTSDIEAGVLAHGNPCKVIRPLT